MRAPHEHADSALGSLRPSADTVAPQGHTLVHGSRWRDGWLSASHSLTTARSTQTAPLTAAGTPISDRPFTRTGLLGFVGPVSSPTQGLRPPGQCSQPRISPCLQPVSIQCPCPALPTTVLPPPAPNAPGPPPEPTSLWDPSLPRLPWPQLRCRPGHGPSFHVPSAPRGWACPRGLRPDQCPCPQDDLVFVVGKLEGLMVVGVRRHNADDVVATALAVEPMKFVYRGR